MTVFGRLVPTLPLLLAISCTTVPAPADPAYPVTPELFVSQFDGAEGITFNGAGELHVGANRAIWRIAPDGSVTRLADSDSNLGQAGIGERDVLAADFGPTNVFAQGDEQEIDGVVWRVSPDGSKRAVARGIADPNAIAVLPDRSFLVSDDGTDKIYRVSASGEVSIWSQGVPYPNGIALSPDRRTLWVAQIFTRIGPVERADALWAVTVNPDGSAGEARLVGPIGSNGPDGLAVDERGRVYVADNGNGRVLRYDPHDGAVVVVAEGMPSIASLVFGEGAFGETNLYATTTFSGGGDIWRIPVGVRGDPPIR